MGRSTSAAQTDVRHGLPEVPRGKLSRTEPPQRPEEHFPDNSYCPTCGAVYQNQHWILDSAQSALLHEAGAPNEVTCPACRIAQDGEAQGELILRGGYWSEHRELIENLLRNEAIEALGKNPLERILDMETAEGEMLVKTTTAKLAQRLGRKLHSAHKGHVEYHFSNGHTAAHVYWERDA
jgi:hypothetical protein